MKHTLERIYYNNTPLKTTYGPNIKLYNPILDEVQFWKHPRTTTFKYKKHLPFSHPFKSTYGQHTPIHQIEQECWNTGHGTLENAGKILLYKRFSKTIGYNRDIQTDILRVIAFHNNGKPTMHGHPVGENEIPWNIYDQVMQNTKQL